MITFSLCSKNSNYYKNVKHLYEHAFPIEERPPFNMLMSWERQETYEIIDNNNFIGLITTVKTGDLLYIFFLAIKKKYRHQGYGSKVIKGIMDKYSSLRIYLLAEDPDIECDNQKERKERISFYNHNGLTSTNIKVTEYEVPYVILSNNKKVTKEDFLMTMLYILGEDWYNKYYVENVY